MGAPRVWPVLVVYVLAFATIVAFSVVAAFAVRGLFPELSEREVFEGLPWLLAGAMASSTALMATVLSVVRPLEPARLRLRPGRETGPVLVAVIVGTLALGQALDSATALVGLANRGAMASIRRALEGATGSDLFAAVLVVGIMAGPAEEIFFRGYMETVLVQRWRPSLAVLVTSLGFGLLHLEWIHATLAFVLGLWLGFVTERVGCVLPAIVAHAINNTLFTLTTAGGIVVEGTRANMLAGGASALVFIVGVVWLCRALPGTVPVRVLE